MRIPVFGSCPSYLNEEQFAAKKIILSELDRVGFEWRSIGQTDYPTQFPLREVFLAVLAKHVVQKPKPPRIQALLKRARENKARLAATPALTKEALAREIGINPGQFARLLQLADLAPEIQQHILALPPTLGHGPITERRLRPIAKLANPQEQTILFRGLLQLDRTAH